MQKPGIQWLSALTNRTEKNSTFLWGHEKFNRQKYTGRFMMFSIGCELPTIVVPFGCGLV
jgi:hypothetical protein